MDENKRLTKDEILSSPQYQFHQKEILECFLKDGRMYTEQEIDRLFRFIARGIGVLFGGKGKRLTKKEREWFDELFKRPW